MARLVLTDASPLIGLAIVEGLPWLHGLFGSVSMPREVEREVLGGGVTRGENAIRQALTEGWLRVLDKTSERPDFPNLDEGEAACIRTALACRDRTLLLMDERAGRMVAREQGLQVAGTAAVIGMAKMHGLTPSARAVFERLLRSDFRISAQVIRTVLSRVGEHP